MCVKIAKISAMLLATLAVILVLFGFIGHVLWFFGETTFLNVANYWNFLYASVPFSLLAICSILFVIAAKDKA